MRAYVCVYVCVLVQSLDLNKEQTKFRVKLPPSQQPLHHPGVTFPSWRAVIAWPDLDPSGKHQGLPESSSTMLTAKGIRWPKWSLHTGHMHRVIKPQGNVARVRAGKSAKFPRGRRNLLRLYLPPGLEKYISVTGTEGGGLYLHRRVTVYTNTADGLIYVCILI